MSAGFGGYESLIGVPQKKRVGSNEVRSGMKRDEREKRIYLIITSILSLILSICLLLLISSIVSSSTITTSFSIFNPQDD